MIFQHPAVLPTSVLQPKNPEYKGKLAFAAGETDFQPIVTSVVHTYGQAGRLSSGSTASNPTSANHIYPDSETIADEVNRGAVAFGVVNQYYWYRMKAELGAGKHSLPDRLFLAATGSWPRPRCLRCRRAQILQGSGCSPAVRGLPGLHARPGHHRPLHQLRVSAGPRGAAQWSAETPFDQLAAQPVSPSPELGDGSTA